VVQKVTKRAKKSYGKHSWRFWLVVYVIVAVVVYGIIYLILAHHNGNGGSTNASNGGYNW
jgi:hypothetical protein